MLGSRDTKHASGLSLAERVRTVLLLCNEDREAFLQSLPKDVVFVDRPQVLESQVKDGRQMVRRWLEDISQIWAGMRWDVDEVVAVDEHRVVASMRICGKGVESGLYMEDAFAVLVTERDGELARFQGFATKQEAIEAAS